MSNQENNTEANATNNLEDLNLQENDATEVKGGPAYMKLGDIKGEAQTSVAQTREHILLARQ